MDFTQNQFEGYGESPANEVEELIKALQAHEGETDIANLSQGGALQVQSLESTLALLTFQQKHFKFYKDIGTVKGFSTLEEYSVQDGYGPEGGFVSQMENPEEGDPDMRRAYAVMKYIRTLWKTSDVLPLTKTISNAEVIATQAAVMRALRITEKSLFFGNSAMVPQSFDGIIKTIEDNGTTDHIFDLRGASLSEANMRDGAQLIHDNYGTPTDLYLSTAVQTGVDQLVGTTANNARLNIEAVSTQSGLIALGHGVTQMRTSYGNFNFKPDIFLGQESWGVPKIKNPAAPSALIEGATSAKAPATPSHSVAINAPTVSGSLWAASGSGGRIAGTYKYRIVAVNQYGKSAADAADAGSAVAANGALTITITAGAGAYAATSFEVYGETTPASGVFRYITTVTAAAASYQDKNEYLPGTGISVLVDNTTTGELRTMALSQLAPIHKVEYAKIAPYRWGTVNFYIVPKWYAPLRYVLFRNIGVSKATQSPIIDL